MSDYEMVGVLEIRHEVGFCAYDLSDEIQVKDMLREAQDMAEGSYAPGEFDRDSVAPLVSITIQKRPKGWLESLPEFAGW